MKKHTEHQEPLVSIITPLYNASAYIEQTIKSVQAQRYTNWEHLIVDDGSTDTSYAQVAELAKEDARIQLMALPKNKGAAHSRNIATEKAKGSYIAFLDADDLWHPEKLEKQVRLMRQHNVLVSHTSYVHIDQEGHLLGKRVRAIASLTYKKQHTNNYVGNLTGIYNAEKLGKIAAPTIRKRQDWALWLEALRRAKQPAIGLQQDLASEESPFAAP